MNNLTLIDSLRFNTTYYFTKLFTNYSIEIDFKKKKGGVQLGLIAEIVLKEEGNKLTSIYHIKTHQNGTSSAKHERGTIDLKELFIYKFFEFISIGPEMHFYFDDFNSHSFFIASRDLGQDFRILTEFEEETLNEEFEKNLDLKNGLIVADFFSKLLFLGDITTNPSNFGFLKDNDKNVIKIIDFYSKTDEFTKSYLEKYDFYDTFFEITASSLASKGILTKYYRTIDKCSRISVALNILNDFNIKSSLEKTTEWIKKYTSENYQQIFDKDSKKDSDSIETIRNSKENEFDEFVKFVYRNFESFIEKFDSK